MRILERLSWDEIARALGARAQGSPQRAASGASIDSRTLEPGDVFFALKGERVDGHEHVESAFNRGASCAVIKEGIRASHRGFSLVVENPETALFELSRLVRSRSSGVFVAITGSAGKTTAKEFTAELLRAGGAVHATRGNLNNHLGVPLTLLGLETDHWAAVIECGMSHAGELSRLARLIRPQVAVITGVAPAHLEFFESVEQIADAKAEIFETLREGDTAVAPAGEPLLFGRAPTTGASTRLFGDGPESWIRATDVSMSLDGSRFQLECDGSRVAVSLPAPGPHAISNFLAAAAVATTLGIPAETIAERAPLLKTAARRGAILRLQDDIVLIDDSYNSNPVALRRAIETLALATDRRRVACLGEMLELGPEGPRLHREAGEGLGDGVDLLLAVGTLAPDLVLGASALPPQAKRVFENSAALASAIGDYVKSHDAVLVKGSRGVRMERVVEALLAIHPGAAA